MARKWIQKAIKHPGALRRTLGAKNNIPAGRLRAAAKERRRHRQACAPGDHAQETAQIEKSRIITRGHLPFSPGKAGVSALRERNSTLPVVFRTSQQVLSAIYLGKVTIL